MVAVRIAFDASLPVFMARDAKVAGRNYQADEPLPWRELGVDESMLQQFYSAGLVYFTAANVDADTVKPAAVKAAAAKPAARKPPSPRKKKTDA